jgi:sugar phosphate isomerase/epimerase
MTDNVGLSTGIAYQHPIEMVLQPICDSGFHIIEIATARDHIDLSDTRRLRELARVIHEMGLTVCSLHAPFGHDIDITDPDPAFRQQSFDRLTRAADALTIFGGGLYVIHPGGEDHDWVWDRETRIGRSAEGLNVLWQCCRERRLDLVVETPLPHLLGGQPDDLERLLRVLPREGTGVCLDTSHTVLGGFLFEVMDRFASRLVHVQASDNRGHTDDHLPPGDGIIDWPKVESKLAAIGYQGVFLLELAGNGDVREHVAHAARRAHQTLSLA